MSDIVPVIGGALEKTGAVIVGAVRFGIVVAQLTAASATMMGLSYQVRSTFRYVEDCATSVGRLADQAAALQVDQSTVNEHREASTVMRSCLAEAEAMAVECEEMSTLFHETADAHIADYGSVADAANNMPDGIEMADRQFYSNR
ncbi:hypothetical protein [Streptomyces melanogenes]|uniref:hypothetical protein n=1 Tax=Streptomyces melanogenes TaxID=67326 RepID=UPI00167EB845|nr:hypothetical protein [Streptomyces melanogenes]GGP90098.1 hypothetical protein GCM10010278_80690 [Streptomyces melanogenes]